MVITYKVQYIITSVKVSNRNDKYKYFKIVKIRVGVCIWNRPFQRKFRTRFELLKYRQLPSGSITWRRGLTLDSILGQSIIQIWSEEAYVCVSAAALCAFNVIPTTCVHCNQHVLCLYATPCSFPLCVYPCVCFVSIIRFSSLRTSMYEYSTVSFHECIWNNVKPERFWRLPGSTFSFALPNTSTCCIKTVGWN